MTRLYSLESAMESALLEGSAVSWRAMSSVMLQSGLHAKTADLAAWSFWVQGPFDNLEAHLSVVDVSDSLKLIKYQGFIKILTPGGVVDPKVNTDETGKRRFILTGLTRKTLNVIERVFAFYDSRMKLSENDSTAVGFRAWLALDDSTPYNQASHDPDREEAMVWYNSVRVI